MKQQVDLALSLNTLLGQKKDSGPYPTPLAERCNEALDLPLKDLNWKQIRMLIGQDIGLVYLMPWAIDCLKKRPLCCVEFYPGDLMVACLQIKREYWADNLGQWHELSSVLGDLDSAMTSIGEVRMQFEHGPFQP